jgi:hypothetical protein
MSALGKKLRLCEGGTVMFKCPGCGYSHGVHIAPAADGRARPVWGFNGDGDRPTFTPSVLLQTEMWEPPVTPENLAEWKRAPWEQVKVPKVCHSFVTDGRIQFLSDCTHALAGQTVELPDYPGEKSP